MFKQLFCLSYLDTECFLLWVCTEHTWVLQTIPDANTVQDHISDIPREYLEDLLEETIQCLHTNDITVIIDATGVSLNQYGQWMTVRNGKRKLKKKFVKIHLAVDRDNGKILVGICSKGWKHEHKFGVQIVKSLRRSCSKHGLNIIAELLDAGYLSREMTDEIEKSHATPYIKMKKNSRSRSKAVHHGNETSDSKRIIQMNSWKNSATGSSSKASFQPLRKCSVPRSPQGSDIIRT